MNATGTVLTAVRPLNTWYDCNYTRGILRSSYPVVTEARGPSLKGDNLHQQHHGDESSITMSAMVSWSMFSHAKRKEAKFLTEYYSLIFCLLVHLKMKPSEVFRKCAI